MRRLLGITILFLAAFVRLEASSSSVAEVPFEYRGGLIWVRVSVPQSTEPLNFLLDSGAGVSVVNLRTAQRLGLKLGERVSVRGVGSTTDGFWPVRVSAKADEVELPKDCLAVDLSELGKACDCGVDGLLGADFFGDHVVQVDFAQRKVRLLRSSEVTVDATVVDLKVSRRALLAAVAVNGGKPQWLRLDTGCTSALQWVAAGARKLASKRSVSIGLAEIDIPTITTSVKLGETTFDSVATGLHRRQIFPGESGLLGNGLLARFERVTIDSKAGKMVLQGRRAEQ